MAATDLDKPPASVRAGESRRRPSLIPPPATERAAHPPERPPPRRLLKPYRPHAIKQWRFFKAYSVTLLVIGSYLWLSFKRRLFGSAWHERALVAVHKRNAKRIENALLELQGLFIKVGQLLSIMANFLPEEFRQELEGMQDAVPPRPFEEIDARIRKELGKGPDELFASFERAPIAAASLGQVHEARLADGTRCAVKVQHQDIEEIVQLDLVLIRKIMGIVQWFVPVQGLDNYYREVRELLLEELDFGLEAENIRHIRANFTKDPAVDTPEVVAELSTSRVLTLTYVEGVKVGALDEIDRMGIDRKKLAEKIVHAFCQMIFVDGVYHCDPHPGNLLVRKLPSGEPQLVLIDFGAVGELSQPMREGIPEFLEGVLRRDTDRLIKAMRKMGFLAYGSDEVIVEKVIEHFHRKFQDEVKIESFNLKDIKLDPQRSFDNLIDLRNMNVGLKELSSSIHIPRDWVLLERTLLLLTGVCTNLDPNLNPMQLIRPYLEQFVLGNRDWTQIAIEAVRDTALKAIALPEKLDRYVQKAIRGELEIRVRGIREGIDAVYAIGRQMMYLGLTVVLGGGAIYAHAQWHDARLARLLGYLAIAPGTMFLIFSVLDRPSRRR